VEQFVTAAMYPETDVTASTVIAAVDNSSFEELCFNQSSPECFAKDG
jgi:hypothetical protein